MSSCCYNWVSRLTFTTVHKLEKGHPLRVEDTYIWRALQGLSTETVYLHHSTNAEDMHYSSWGVSCESQSSPLRFFVESNATDHQTGRKISKTLFIVYIVPCVKTNPCTVPGNRVSRPPSPHELSDFSILSHRYSSSVYVASQVM